MEGNEEQISLTEEQRTAAVRIAEEWASEVAKALSASRNYGKRKDADLYGDDSENSGGGKGNHCSDSRNCPHLSDGTTVLPSVWRRVSVINSRMSQGERFDQFERAREGKIQIMVGPRSALFTPFQKLGLIIIDEEHESSYISESTPRYHARDVAIERARMEGAYVLMGSATPSVDSYYKGQQGIYKWFPCLPVLREAAFRWYIL